MSSSDVRETLFNDQLIDFFNDRYLSITAVSSVKLYKLFSVNKVCLIDPDIWAVSDNHVIISICLTVWRHHLHVI